MAKPIKFVYLDDTSGQFKLEGWLCVVFIFYTPFIEEMPFYCHLGEEAHSLSKKEVSFYWVNLGGGLWSSFVAVSQTILAFGSSLILWSML